MESLPIRRNRRWLVWIILAALTPGIFVQIQRGRSALTSALTAGTSGCEEESFYTVWRVNHGLAAYVDSSAPPYSTAYFNWLFYKIYGAASAGHPDEEIPHWGRLCTLLGAALAFLLSGWALTEAVTLNRLAWGVLAAGALWSSGLFGWWLFTMRPDIWALTLEIGSVAWFLAIYPRRRWLAAIGGVGLAYLAWSFKQSNVSAVGTLFLFLAWRRERSLATTVAGLFIFLDAVTLIVGGHFYRANLAAAAGSFDSLLGWVNLLHAAGRTLPLMILPVYALGLWLGDGRQPWSGAAPIAVQFAMIGLLVSGILAFAASFKLGASYNYYFSAAFFATLLGVHSRHALQSRTFLRVGDGLLAAALAGAVTIAGLQLSGRLGTLSLATANAVLTQRLEVWEKLPSPRFSDDRRLAMPWLNPGLPLFIPAYNYPADRARHRPFQHDGIGGLIRDGYFAALLLPDATGDYYDGALLSCHYDRTYSVAGLAVYRSKSSASFPNPK
jgi:hypothetical protein